MGRRRAGRKEHKETTRLARTESLAMECVRCGWVCGGTVGGIYTGLLSLAFTLVATDVDTLSTWLLGSHLPSRLMPAGLFT